MAIRYKKNKITNIEAIIKWGLLGALKIKRMIFCNKEKKIWQKTVLCKHWQEKFQYKIEVSQQLRWID